MTRRASVVTVLAGLLAWWVVPAVPALASAPPSTVTVTGTGTASGTPDELGLTLDVSATAAAVSAALDAASRSMSRVQDALLADGATATDLQTSGLDVQPQYNQQGAITGYTADEQLTAELHGLAKAGKEITDAVGAGGNAVRVDSVQLDLTDQSARLIASARAAAIADARTRAEQYATSAGRKLGDVLSITEGSAVVPVRPLPAGGAMFGGAKPVPVSAGSQQVTASVTVVYQLN